MDSQSGNCPFLNLFFLPLSIGFSDFIVLEVDDFFFALEASPEIENGGDYKARVFSSSSEVKTRP